MGFSVGVLPSQVAALSGTQPALTATVASGFDPVSDSVERALQRSSTAKVIVTADDAALQDVRARAILGQMTQIGESLYSGRLSGAAITDLAGSGGVRIDIDATLRLPVTMETQSESSRPKSWVKELWDTDVTIPDTDSRLLSSQQQTGIDGTGSVVAVMDTGVDPNASGLVGQVIHRVDFSAPTSSCSDNGFLDPNGHGTHVASIIAGKPGNFSPANMRGVAPGANIIDVRVFNCTALTTDSEILSAIDWIIANKATYGIDAVNMSIGASGNAQTGQDSKSIAVNRMVAAGLFVSVAAGNDGAAPGTIASPGVAQFATTVGAATVSKYGSYQAFYSSAGPTGDGRAGIDFLAPGSGIIAAQTTAVQIAGGGTVKAGTSMAAPYVAGIAALLAQQHPSESPSGTACDVGAGCPIGVVASSMTNPVQDRIKASDWYASGIDNMSGAGLVSASATILGETPAPAKSVSGTFRADSPNTIRIPPHSGSAVISLYTPVSVKTDMWDSSKLNVLMVDRSFSARGLEVPCTKLASGVCNFASGSWTPNLYAYLLRPSTTETVLQVKSPKSLAFHMNFSPLESTPTLVTGIAVTNANLSSATSGNITLSRTVSSSVATSFTVTGPSTVSVPATVVLPAGAPGTSASISVERVGAPRYSEDTIVFSGDDGSLVSSLARLRATGDGRIVYPNAEGYSDRNTWADEFFIGGDGSIVMNSRATGMHGSNGFDTIGIVPAGSLQIEKLNLQQTSPSQLDVRAISADGSSFIAYQFPAGGGLLPGDDDTRENYFVYRRSDGRLTEIGPDIRSFNVMTLLNSRYQLNNDGSETAWTIKLPTGDNPVRLGWQGGDNFGTTRILETFPETTILDLVAFRGSHIIVSVQASTTAPREYRDYGSNGEYRVLDFGSSISSVMEVGVSADGSAVFVIRGNDTTACLDNGSPVQFSNAYARNVGHSFGFVNVVANDCSSVVLTWTNDKVYPMGTNGYRLVKLFANDRMAELDPVAKGRTQGWRSDVWGNHFLRLTPDQLEPGDNNGTWDHYRGLSGTASPVVLGPWVEPPPGTPTPSIPNTPVSPGFRWDALPTTPATWTPPAVIWPTPPPTIATVAVGSTRSGATLAKFAKMKVAPTSKVAVRVASASASVCRVTSGGIRSLKAGSCRVTITVTPRRGAATTKVVLIKTVRK